MTFNNKEYMREYNQRPEVKERMREYYQRPEVKEKQREYNQRPEVKERKREYYHRPEVKEKQRERMKEYGRGHSPNNLINEVQEMGYSQEFAEAYVLDGKRLESFVKENPK